MKTKDKSRKSVLKELREIRERFNKDMENMTYEQIVEYLKKKKSLHPAMNNSNGG